ncbi:anthrone oxygenase family protein [Herbiconiux daphne]|uniref:DUF1772 domain-containing protein n=1 Tax=Herbiconiux daphne TaxID=2970914 RepID=A0ABT2GZY7_9MICO|nr:anthrone oxygenase family protein [Herbiconiux daphne]MCS5732329.1 DUF1772 domain-containing protein [Herbiconiux daphne]
MSQTSVSLEIVAALCGATALGAAVVAGVFFAFSGFVMRGLEQAPAASGLVVMQSINRTAVRPPLMVTLFGTLLAGLAACILLAVTGSGLALWWAVAGEAVYLIGVVAVTVGFHVPRNNALADADAATPAGLDLWRRYALEWTRGNHVRALAGAVAAVLFGVAAALVLVGLPS